MARACRSSEERSPSSITQYEERKLEIRELASSPFGSDLAPGVHAEPRDRRTNRLLNAAHFFERLLVAEEGSRAGAALERQSDERILARELALQPFAHAKATVEDRLDGAVADVHGRADRNGSEKRQLFRLLVDAEDAAAHEALRIVRIALRQANAQDPSPIVDMEREGAEQLLGPDVESRLAIELLDHVAVGLGHFDLETDRLDAVTRLPDGTFDARQLERHDGVAHRALVEVLVRLGERTPRLPRRTAD